MTFIFEKVESWMTKNGRQPNECLTPEFGRDVLLFGVDMVSYNYFTEELVKKSVRFNEKVIQEMGEMIKKNKSQILRIESLSPTWTAVKVISSLQTMEEYNFKSSFQKIERGKVWIISDEKLGDKNEIQLWENRIKLRENGKAKVILVIVCDTTSPSNAESLVAANEINQQFQIILITRMESDISVKDSRSANVTQSAKQDDMSFKDLDDETQRRLLSTMISFQPKRGITRRGKYLI